jgi:hypothetical protein
MEALLTMAPTARGTRVLMTRGRDTLLKGQLPPLEKVLHERAARALLEALSLWVDERLCVALYAENAESCFRFGLADELGVGARSVFYAIEMLAPRHRVARRPREAAVRDEQLTLLAKPVGAR